MKRYNYSNRSALLLAVACLVLNMYMYATGPVMGAGPQRPRAVAQPVGAPAHLIIRRNPNLGFNVIVKLWIDGVPAGSVGYGHTYEGPLAPGHHVLAVLAGPNPRWPVPWQLPLDVQSGRTYSFTAVTDGSGNLVPDGRFGFPPRVQ
jgi:hypothetical protein